MVSEGDKIKVEKKDAVYWVVVEVKGGQIEVSEEVSEEYHGDYWTEIVDIVEGDSHWVVGDKIGVFEEEVVDVEND